tara:strand:+ start:678 stop:1352 length:675 start_codon:yes stop_codon:yes gene_type:complete
MSNANKIMNKVNGNTLWILSFTIFFLYSFRNENILLPIFFVSVLSYIFYNHNDKLSELKNTIFDMKLPDKRDIHYNDKIVECLNSIEKYKKYNLNEYHNGKKYFHKFMDNIHVLENKNLSRHKQHLENAKYFLNKCINHFQYITTSIPDRKLIDGIKYGDFNSTKKLKKLHKHIDDLYKVCNNILFTISNDKEQKFLKNPDIYSGHVNIIEPEPSNNHNNYDLY